MVAQQRAPVRGSEFRAECRSSHRSGNDPTRPSCNGGVTNCINAGFVCGADGVPIDQ